MDTNHDKHIVINNISNAHAKEPKISKQDRYTHNNTASNLNNIKYSYSNNIKKKEVNYTANFILILY
jgi:hypothetical protein